MKGSEFVKKTKSYKPKMQRILELLFNLPYSIAILPFAIVGITLGCVAFLLTTFINVLDFLNDFCFLIFDFLRTRLPYTRLVKEESEENEE